MRKLLPLALCLLLCLTACARAESLTGKADGYGGELTVDVRMNGNDIVGIEVTSHNETESVAGQALETIPKEILAKNGTEGVDVVSGATITSKAIIAAVNNAVDPAKYPGGNTEASPLPAVNSDVYLGFGVDSLGRVGPGSDANNVPVYSFNEVFCSALFDKDGRVLDIYIDQMEVATPNYDSTTMPMFSGFPGQGAYASGDNGAASGDGAITDDDFLGQIAAWKTKRERGGNYQMTAGTWAAQMDAFQRVFIGKTVDEIDKWFTTYCSDRNGRPLKASNEDAADKAKYDKLSDEDKQMLADVTASATMSLNDGHGNILSAIRKAYDNRIAVRFGAVDNAATPAQPAPAATAVPAEEKSGNG